MAVQRIGRTNEPSPRASPAARLNPAMACDTAFRIVARRHLDAVVAQHMGTCSGDPDALHEIRIALTHLRTTIRFFSPMVDDSVRRQIWAELKWLNGQLGLVRDLDVAIDRIKAAVAGQPEALSRLQSWNERRVESHRLLARALQSARYRQLIENTASWIESGPWSTRKGKEFVQARATPIGVYAAQQLAKWEKRLLRKSRRLEDMDAEKRHRLRLFNKRLTCSIQSLEDLFSDKRFSKQKAALKHLRRAQRCLGQLNDDARGRILAAALYGKKSDAVLHFKNRKRQRRLLRAAAAAYKELDDLKPFRT
jgi:CHAD domain-containing protein